ncbi:MAG: hypothetical protein BSOLF_0555 [Candidatus Carbobacillus altaicus]|uniref:Copper amine oxidase-like N-terminal domain-containing protein n=1 Tax=Candidatus Carbonibacillus altaicus TaxID=2163959 RepID=A0A2R6Y0P2_9BACL|nr:MAG: hypothetical protein BSOLF_0555 [Candidatus Carbobacillus altaicus]
MKGSKVLSIVLSLALAFALLPFGALTAKADDATKWVAVKKITTDKGELKLDETTEARVAVVVDPYFYESEAKLYVIDEDKDYKKFKVNDVTDYVYNFKLSGGDIGKRNSVSFDISFPNDENQSFSGELYLVIEGKNGHFKDMNEKLVIGETGTSQAAAKDSVSVVNAPSFYNSGDVKLKFKGKKEDKEKQIKVTLPQGFKWSNIDEPLALIDDGSNNISSDNVKKDKDNDRVLVFTVPQKSTNNDEYYEVVVDATIVVVDYSTRYGDVKATVTNADGKESTIVVGKYGQYQVTVKGEAEDVTAGRVNENVGKIIFDETVAHSLVGNRYINVTLPEGAEWDVDSGKDGFKISGKAGIVFDHFAKIDKKDRVAVFRVDSESKSAGETTIEIKKLKVGAGLDEGSLTVEISGTAGVSGKVAIANVKHPLTVTVENKAKAVLGQWGQTLGDIVITEKEAGTLRDDATIQIKTTDDYYGFTAVGGVEVRKGNIDVAQPKLSSDGKTIEISVRNASTEAAEIVVKGIKATVNSVAPTGDLKVNVTGDAVVDEGLGGYSVAAATVVTPDEARAVQAKFTIDSANYVVNGETKTMDVAPFIQDSRTFVPVKYVAEAVGVSESNVTWNPNWKTVTIFKGDRVIQMKIGSKTLLVNGSAIEMDTAPVIKDARTVLPIAWVAKALGVDYKWDDTDRSVEFYVR